MNRTAGIAVLVVGIFLVGWGINASNALSSEFTRIFTGSPTNRAIYLMVGGALLAIVGASMAFKARRARE
jgi:hypothetical protein